MKKAEGRRIALVGDVALELIAPYFREAGWETYIPSGFGTWRQEVLDPQSALYRFGPDLVFDVTSRDTALEKEVPAFFDERMRALASMPYSLAGIRAIVEEAEFAHLSSPKKALALDADGTLWRGTISEDGADSIEAYAAFQDSLKELSAAGIPLILLTKNDAADFTASRSPFAACRMPLSLEDFASVKAGWNPKAENLAAAMAELNLGVDSAVFIDDNPAERAAMSAAHPGAVSLPVPASVATDAGARQFVRRLKEYFFVGSAGATEEDRLRANDYKARAARLGIKASTPEEYLRGLDLRVQARLAEATDVPRLAQMAAKTNQFNATAIRRSAEDFAALLADPSKHVFVYRASDSFADQGLVAYAVIDMRLRRVTDFAMSCRAMGRTLEYFIWHHLVSILGFEPEIDYRPTAKNAPFAAFLADRSRPHFYTEVAPVQPAGGRTVTADGKGEMTCRSTQ